MLSLTTLTLRKMPFVRLLLFFIIGILLQWFVQFSAAVLLISFTAIFIFLLLFFLFPSAKKFSLQWLQGFAVLLLFVAAGAITVYIKDIRNNKNQVSLSYQKGDILEAILQEPLVEKPKSFKAICVVNKIYRNGIWRNAEGKILVYFKNDSSIKNLGYGSQIIFRQPLQKITNAGNPGEFDYKQYCLFQGIQQQVFLSSKNYIVLPDKQTDFLHSFLFSSRNYILQTLHENIPGKKEQSVAEALLIGYRDDVDKNLLEAYSNTGVVHIIVISGLHMGMIYGLVIWLISFFKNKKWYRFIKPVFILFVIWSFALITGARPSILRVTAMLSFIIIGEALQRKTNVYNTLSASAFCLLFINPFYLWDAGFQLSFAAVTSIVTFYKPVYHWVYFENKLLNKVWQLAAVTIAVQFFTLPLVLYHFHRFPVFFLFANFIAVPLACIILYFELFLLLIAKWTSLAAIVGKLITVCISLMNNFIENTNRLPFSIIDNVYVNAAQTIFLFIVIIAFVTWLMQKSSKAFLIGLSFLCLFILLKNIFLLKDENQKKIVVYNISKHSAIDIFDGNHFSSFGVDNSENTALQNFYLTPSRIFFHANDSVNISSIQLKNNLISSKNKNIFILTKPLPALNFSEKISIDAIIISQNPRIKISDVAAVFSCKEIIFDSSNPLWKIALWRKDCDSLHLRFHSVPEQGAFLMDL
jgi:competence protein ComEC